MRGTVARLTPRMDAICSSVAPIREGSKTDWHRRRVLAHLVSLAISWALLTRIGSIVGFRGISKGKHNTAHLERELESAMALAFGASILAASKILRIFLVLIKFQTKKAHHNIPVNLQSNSGTWVQCWVHFLPFCRYWAAWR